MSSLKSAKRNIIIKLIIVSNLFFFMYLFVPFYLYENILYEFDFYQQYNFRIEHVQLQFLSIVILWILLGISVYYISNLKIENIFNTKYRKINYLVSKYTVLIYIVSRIPLIYYKLTNFELSRDDVLTDINFILYNPYLSFVFSIALASSIIELFYGNKKQISLLLLFGILPEVLLGARIGIFRFIFIVSIIIKWNIRNVFLILFGLFFIGLSRSFFSGYSSDVLYDFIILFFGDPINIFLGSSFLLDMDINQSCGIDGIHFFRSFIFPPLRGYMTDIVPDIANHCMNELEIIGFGGCITNDLILAPLSVFTSLLLMIVVFFAIKNRFINPLVHVYFIIIVVSSYPYILRNGIVSTINHVITLQLWVIIPLFLIIKYIKDNRSVK